MSYFDEKLKKHFYGNGASGLSANSNVCLLDAAGEPIGCDSIDKVAAYAMCKNEFVDMGLPSGTLWAKKNLGALKETDYGDYFSWGNLNGHSEGSEYDFSQDVYDATDAAIISQDLDASQDAVRANKGGVWRIPTQYDFAELFNSAYTTNEWTTVNGVNGRKVTSKINGKSIFFPAAGGYDGTSLDSRGSLGFYWSSSWISADDAGDLFFDSSSVYPQNSDSRLYGFSLRGVM